MSYNLLDAVTCRIPARVHGLPGRCCPNRVPFMHPWEQTFHWLATTGNRAAVELLLRALKSPHLALRQAAVVALMRRPDEEAHQAVLTQINPAEETWGESFAVLPTPFLDYLRQVLVRGPVDLRATVCQFIAATGQFDFIPLLAHLLENRELQPREVVASTLQELCRKLGVGLQEGTSSGEGAQVARVAEQVRRALAVATGRFSKHHSREVVEGLIVLAGGNSRLLLDVFRSALHPARQVLVEILSHDTTRPTLRVLCDFLRHADTPDDVLRIIGQRGDLPFLKELLRTVGAQPGPIVRRQLKALRRLRCLEHLDTVLAALEESEQEALAALAVHSGLPRSEGFKIVEKLLTEGLPAGRRAAAEALNEFQGAQANALALRAMSDPDPLVQAAILPQLRRRGVVGALPHIIRLLESPHPAVRKAARRSLREFSFARFLQVWDLLPPHVRQNTGMLVKRVDGRTAMLLRAELVSPFRLRRLRALSVAQELELVPRLESAIIPLLQDEDHAVRAEAAAALAQSDSVVSYQALVEALHDPNAVVRAVAARSLEQRRQRGQREQAKGAAGNPCPAAAADAAPLSDAPSQTILGSGTVAQESPP